ncbi:MAG: DUF1311 domain-containing protein [Phenylobacterium sp.]|nr:MAG: DUF1311 domain-containing protein [Phenylobacterium sp.]
MPTDRIAEPFPETTYPETYKGFAGPTPPVQPARPPARRWPMLLAIGGAAAIVLGAGAGLLIRPNLASHDTDAAERTAAGVPIEVDRPPPEAVPASNGKLEVLSPDQAAAARAVAPAAPVYQPGPVPPLPPVAADASGDPDGATAARTVRPPPAYAAGPAEACAAGSPAEQMVCADPGLQAADRDLNRAYRRALAVGVPPSDLRGEQRDWLAIREDAARRSPRAVANVYAQRIDELNGMADDAQRDRRDEQDDPRN